MRPVRSVRFERRSCNGCDFFPPDGGRAHPLRGHGDQPAVRHDAGARKTAAAAPRQDVGDA